MSHRWFETGSKAALDEITPAAAAADPPWAVRKVLEEVTPCETGYLGKRPCGDCASVEYCAGLAAAELHKRFPDLDWGPAIRDVLGVS